MDFIKAFFGRRSEKKRLRQLEVLHSTFATLQKAEAGGLLWFDPKNRVLFIEEPLAMVMMANVQMWKNFLQNVFTWQYWEQCQAAWDGYILEEELKAVRQVKKKTPILKKSDIERIRYARRQEIGMSDMEPPKVEPFDFLIIRSKAEMEEKDDAEAKAAGKMPFGDHLAVGHYDPESGLVEMAAWEDVKKFLEK